MHLMPKAAHDALPIVLGRELDLLEGLAFRLEMQRLVLRDRSDRWLPRACCEIEVSLDQLRWAELIRAVHVGNLARELGLAAAPDLQRLIAAVGEPWKEIFEDHRRAFLDVTGEIRRLAWRNRAGLADRARDRLAPDGAGPELRVVGVAVDLRSAGVDTRLGTARTEPGRGRGGDGRREDDGSESDAHLLDIVCAIAASSLERVISPSLSDFLAG
jgi:hypothetical protein